MVKPGAHNKSKGIRHDNHHNPRPIQKESRVNEYRGARTMRKIIGFRLN